MRIYLAGPMRGYKDFNFPAFFDAAEKLRSQGHTVFNPAERDTKAYGSEVLKTESGSEAEVSKKLGYSDPKQLARDCFLADTQFICAEADAIALLPGWENSKGAQAERALCLALGHEIIIL